ncbi:MAG: hypothetical protein KA515_00770 [Candidatus Pacebacteria bacterium]|nr:hypothetical protein [Candidatus Paceibacterota bacterium]
MKEGNLERPENKELSSGNKPSRRGFLRSGFMGGIGLSLSGVSEAQNRGVEKPAEGGNTSGLEIPTELSIKTERLKAYFESPKIKSLRESIGKKIKIVMTSFPRDIEYLVETFDEIEGKKRECVRIQRSLLEPDLPPEAIQNKKSIIGRYQKDIINAYNLFGNIHDFLITREGVEKNALRRKTKPTVSGFEQTNQSTNEEISSTVASLPEKLWTDVAGISFSNQMKADTAGEAQNLSLGFGDALLDPKSRKIVNLFYFSGIEQETKEETIETLIHELAHFVDWGETVNLTLEERLEFYNEILDIFFDPKRSHDWYVDGYLPKKYQKMDTRNLEDYLINDQVKELWPQLVSRYFVEQTTGEAGRSSAKLTEQERKFTEKWLLKNGIKF